MSDPSKDLATDSVRSLEAQLASLPGGSRTCTECGKVTMILVNSEWVCQDCGHVGDKS